MHNNAPHDLHSLPALSLNATNGVFFMGGKGERVAVDGSRSRRRLELAQNCNNHNFTTVYLLEAGVQLFQRNIEVFKEKNY